MKAQLDREFRDFMHARWPTMVRLAYGLTGDLGHAEDLARSAFARVRQDLLHALKVAANTDAGDDRRVSLLDEDTTRGQCGCPVNSYKT